MTQDNFVSLLRKKKRSKKPAERPSSKAPLHLASDASLEARKATAPNGIAAARVAERWSEFNRPKGSTKVPIDFLCEVVDGKPDERSVCAVNNTIQWAVTNPKGREVLTKLLEEAQEADARTKFFFSSESENNDSMRKKKSEVPIQG